MNTFSLELSWAWVRHSGNPWHTTVSRLCLIYDHDHSLTLRSTIRGYDRGSTPILLLHAVRPIWIGGKIHAINEDELGFQIIHPGFRDRIYRSGLDIRELLATETGEVLGQVKDCGHQETKAAQGI